MIASWRKTYDKPKQNIKKQRHHFARKGPFSQVYGLSNWRRQWHPTPVLLLGKSHGWRSLVGCSPWGHEESDTTERLPFHFHALEKEMATHSSVLAWRVPGTGEPWAAVSGVAQNPTRLKRLSSSSSSSSSSRGCCCGSVAESCLTLGDPMDCSTPGLPG